MPRSLHPHHSRMGSVSPTRTDNALSHLPFSRFAPLISAWLLSSSVAWAGNPATPAVSSPADAPSSTVQKTRPIRFSPRPSQSYRYDGTLSVPGGLVSNPSGLAFGGRLPDGRIRLWVVSDGSALVRDKFDPHRTVAQLLLDPSGRRVTEVVPITLEAQVSLCDLEAVAIDPRDGGLLLADERVKGLPACGGTGPNGEARSRVFKVSTEGKLLGGPWETDIINTDNNGIEGLAAWQMPDGTHFFAFEERKAGQAPGMIEYRLSPDDQELTKVRALRLSRPTGATQTDAAFRPSDGRLLVVDRDGQALLEVDMQACAGAAEVSCLKVGSLKRLMRRELKLESADPGAHRYGMAEGLTFDDTGALYLALDNNGEPFKGGDNTPRLLRFMPVTQD